MKYPLHAHWLPGSQLDAGEITVNQTGPDLRELSVSWRRQQVTQVIIMQWDMGLWWGICWALLWRNIKVGPNPVILDLEKLLKAADISAEYLKMNENWLINKKAI